MSRAARIKAAGVEVGCVYMARISGLIRPVTVRSSESAGVWLAVTSGRSEVYITVRDIIRRVSPARDVRRMAAGDIEFESDRNERTAVQ